MPRTSPSTKTAKKRNPPVGPTPPADIRSKGESKRLRSRSAKPRRPSSTGSKRRGPQAKARQSVRKRPKSADATSSGRATQAVEADLKCAEACSIEQIAAKIDALLPLIEGPVRETLFVAMRVGQHLLEAKARLPHGHFIPWRTSHWPDLPRSTACEYKQLAEAGWDAIEKAVARVRPGGLLSIKGVLKYLRNPAHGNAKANKDCRAAAKRAAASVSGNSAPVENAVVLPADSAPEESRPESPAGPGQASRPALSNKRARPNRDPEVDYQRQNGTFEPKPLPMSGQDGRYHSRQMHGGSAVAQDKPEPAPEDQLPAADWLDTLPLHRALADPKIFDDEALLWRDTRPLVAVLKAAAAPTPADLRSILGHQRQQWSLRSLIAFVGATRHPGEWAPCIRCQGTGEDRLPGGACLTCRGAGYEVTNAVDDIQEAEAGQRAELS